MKVLTLSASDQEGGAARAALRSHQGLLKCGVDARMLVGKKRSGLSSVYQRSDLLWSRIRGFLDRLPRKALGRSPVGPWSDNWLPRLQYKFSDSWLPDVVNYHWIGGGFTSLNAFSKAKLTAWTLHDSWYFTGGCHLPGNCRRFESVCKQCPQLTPSPWLEGSIGNQEIKYKYAKTQKPIIVAPSKWISESARKSRVLGSHSVHLVPNGLDLDTFSPRPTQSARESMGLSKKAYILGFGAMSATTDRNKGYDLLQESLRKLVSKEAASIQCVVFGGNRGHYKISGIPVIGLGHVSDDNMLANVYSALDLFLLPSRIENAPQVAVEALACGTPVIAYNVGGIPEIVIDGVNGWLAEPNDAASFASRITQAISYSSNKFLRKVARDSVSRFSDDVASRVLANVFSEQLRVRKP
jgi:glycosyltransferase involved in cell wall biosynthesis